MTPDEFASARALQRASPSKATPETVVTKPSARPTGAPAQRSSANRWRVQVASLTTRQHAEAERHRLEGLFELPLSRQLAITEAKLPKGTYYRVQITGLNSHTAAISLCATLQQRNQDCFVVSQPIQPE